MNAETRDARWRTLHRVGGASPLVVALFYLSEFSIAFTGIAFPATAEGWFALFERSKLLGLFVLNSLDVFSIALLGVMFLALYVALRESHPSCVAIGVFSAFLGIAVFVSTRAMMVSATLALSERYAAATTAAQREQLALMLEAMHAPARATPETTGFLFLAVGGAILSPAMIGNQAFGRAIGHVGVAGGLATVANDVCVIVAPSLAAVLMPISGLLWLVWWLLVSRGLFRLSRVPRE